MREGAGEMEEMQYPSLGSLPPERVISDWLVEGLRGLLSLLCYGYLHVGRVGCGLDPGGSLFPSNQGLGRLRDSSVKREREIQWNLSLYEDTPELRTPSSLNGTLFPPQLPLLHATLAH